MSSLNRVMLIGHLGRDPEMRALESGALIATFSVATNENYKDKNGNWQTVTDWHNIVLWRDLAERAEKQLRKGMLVFVEGRLKTRAYKDKDGVERKVTEVLGDTFRLLEKRESSASPFQQPTQERSSTAQEDSATYEDDLPF